MKSSSSTARFTGFVTLSTFLLVVAMLKIAEDIFIPIALTVLLTFLLSPFVVRLTRWRIPKPVAIIVTVTIAFSVIAAVGWVVGSQTVSLAKQLPDYEENIREKLATLRAPQSPDGLSRMTEMVENLQKDLQQKDPAPTPGPVKAKEVEQPVPVEVKAPQPSPLILLQSLVGPLLGPLGTAAIVIVFVIALLFQREDMRDRFIKVISAGRLNLATQALDDAARRVTRYLSMQLVVNASYGVPVGIGLHLIGIPNAVLWGLLATLLRFIPFLGPWVAAAFPVALAAAVDPGWSKLVYTLSLFIVMEVISNNVVEPWLYGASTGISNLALMVAAVFWTWLWGTPGLFLSTPLTVCIMVLGKHVAGLQFLSVLLGSEPVLTPPARFYQRMLSMDGEEMTDLAVKFVEERSLEGFYNDVFMPALYMAEQDRHSGALAEVRQKFIIEASRDLIDELERRSLEAKDSTNAVDDDEPEEAWVGDRLSSPVVFGIAARDDADEVVALMLQHLLRLKGIEAEVVPATTHFDDSVRWINQHQIPITLVSALPPAALFGARQLCRRIRELCPHTRLVVAVWTQDSGFADLRARLRRPKPDAIVTNFGEAIRQIQRLLEPSKQTGEPHGGSSPANSGNEAPASEIAPPLDVDDSEPDELFSAVTRDIARHFEVPVSLVSITALDTDYWRSRTDLTPEISVVQESSGAMPAGNTDEPLLVEDISKDRRFAENALLTDRGVKFYGSVPLRTHHGRVVGCLTVVDTKPRHVDESDRALLEKRASELMRSAEAEAKTASDADAKADATGA